MIAGMSVPSERRELSDIKVCGLSNSVRQAPSRKSEVVSRSLSSRIVRLSIVDYSAFSTIMWLYGLSPSLHISENIMQKAVDNEPYLSHVGQTGNLRIFSRLAFRSPRLPQVRISTSFFVSHFCNTPVMTQFRQTCVIQYSEVPYQRNHRVIRVFSVAVNKCRSCLHYWQFF
jgi:hypothetical protein